MTVLLLLYNFTVCVADVFMILLEPSRMTLNVMS